MTTRADTIAAIATPPGVGSVGIVRLSGPAVRVIAGHILTALPAPRYAVYGPFVAADGALIDQGIALFFPEPHSFTGEDVLELHGHGGAVILDFSFALSRRDSAKKVFQKYLRRRTLT